MIESKSFTTSVLRALHAPQRPLAAAGNGRRDLCRADAISQPEREVVR